MAHSNYKFWWSYGGEERLGSDSYCAYATGTQVFVHFIQLAGACKRLLFKNIPTWATSMFRHAPFPSPQQFTRRTLSEGMSRQTVQLLHLRPLSHPTTHRISHTSSAPTVPSDFSPSPILGLSSPWTLHVSVTGKRSDGPKFRSGAPNSHQILFSPGSVANRPPFTVARFSSGWH